MPTNDPLPLPQLLVALLLGGLAIRFFFFSSSSSASNDGDASTGPPSRTRPNRVREADVLTVLQMFPQLQRRSVMWDLMRNGGNVAATTERILTGRGLENPPVTFQPEAQNPPSTSTGTRPASASTSASTHGSREPAPSSSSSSSSSAQPNLINRYNLAGKLQASGDADEEGTTVATPKTKKQAWSQNKDERQALLQQRREEMIIRARRNMEEKVRAEAEARQGRVVSS